MRLPIAMLLAVTSASCLSEEDGDGTNYIGVDQIEAAYKEAQCKHLAMCGLFPDVGSCLAAELRTSGTTTFSIDPNVTAAIYAGHVIYNSANVKACIDAYAMRACDKTDKSSRTLPLACQEFFRGTLDAGQACFVDAECISQQCSGGSTGTSCSSGVCVGTSPPVIIPAQVGEPCSWMPGCVDGAYCDQTNDMCTSLKPSGVGCTLDAECAYGLGCTGSTGARTCGALPAIGQACSTDGVCRDEGTYCDFTANMCKQLVRAGATCTSSTQCSPYYPCTFTTAGACTQGPGLGQSCTSNNCFDAGTYCDFTTSTCAAVKADGMLCNNSNECESDFCDLSLSTPVCASASTCF